MTSLFEQLLRLYYHLYSNACFNTSGSLKLSEVFLYPLAALLGTDFFFSIFLIYFSSHHLQFSYQTYIYINIALIILTLSFHFFLNGLMLFDLKEIYFSVWYLFNKIFSKWLKDGFVSLHRQVHKYVFPKMII